MAGPKAGSPAKTFTTKAGNTYEDKGYQQHFLYELLPGMDLSSVRRDYHCTDDDWLQAWQAKPSPGGNPMFAHIDVGSERDRPLRRAGIKRPFPVVQRARANGGEVYRLLAGICAREQDADALASKLAKDFPDVRVGVFSVPRNLVHRSTCPRLRKP
jgi:hypothetical protein